MLNSEILRWQGGVVHWTIGVALMKSQERKKQETDVRMNGCGREFKERLLAFYSTPGFKPFQNTSISHRDSREDI